MDPFLSLLGFLKRSPSTAGKLSALVHYFQTVPDHSALPALAILTKKFPLPKIRPAVLKQAVLAQTGLPDWLFEECASVVKDPAETAALLLPRSSSKSFPPELWWAKANGISRESESGKINRLQEIWSELGSDAILPFNEWLIGKYNPPVSASLAIKAFSLARFIPFSVLAYNLSGEPNPENWSLTLLAEHPGKEALPLPLPKCPFREEIHNSDFQEGPLLAGFLYPGIHCQLIWQAGKVQIWAKNEELSAALYFPIPLQKTLTGSGRIEALLLAGTPSQIATEAELKSILNSSPASKKPVRPFFLLALDFLTFHDQDLRQNTFKERRSVLENLLQTNPHPGLIPVPLHPVTNTGEAWSLWEKGKETSAGMMRLWQPDNPASGSGSPGTWKWKKASGSVFLILVHVRNASGSARSNNDVQLSFAATEESGFKVVAHCQASFSKEESTMFQNFVRKHTVERFGPVRTLEPLAVFKLLYQQIQPAPRTKAGLILTEVQLVSWQHDMTPDQAISLSELKNNLPKMGFWGKDTQNSLSD
jgi:DNA ligase-1